MLDSSDVELVHNLIPDAKIIYLLRNPIDRLWSAIRFREKRQRKPITDLPTEHLLQIAESRSVKARSDYVGTLNRWQGIYPSDQIFVGFYDDIKSDPGNTLLKLFEFLEVEVAEEHIPHGVRRRVNSSPERDIPPDFQKTIAANYYDQVKELSRRLGGPTRSWLTEFDAILAS